MGLPNALDASLPSKRARGLTNPRERGTARVMKVRPLTGPRVPSPLRSFANANHNLRFQLDSNPPTFTAIRVGDLARVDGKKLGPATVPV